MINIATEFNLEHYPEHSDQTKIQKSTFRNLILPGFTPGSSSSSVHSTNRMTTKVVNVIIQNVYF